MLKPHLAAALWLSCALFARSAFAFIDPPYLTPSDPGAGQVVSVNIHGGICDGVGADPGYPQISQSENSVRIRLSATRVTDPILNIPTGRATYAIGASPPGTYTLQVDIDYLGDIGGIHTDTLGVIPFTAHRRLRCRRSDGRDSHC